MKRGSAYILGALLMIVVGILLLLQNLGYVKDLGDFVWAIVFGAGGLIFLAVFAANRVLNWWAIIPGLVLLSIGLLIAIGGRLGNWGDALLLASISLAFWIIYFNNRQFWWAVIPAGTLATLTLITGLSEAIGSIGVAGLLIIGLAATFLLLYFLPTPQGRMRWAIYPAGALLVIGLAMSLATASALHWLWAVALILGGAFLIFRTVSARKP